MPIAISEIDSTVEVDAPAEGGSGGAAAATALPSPQAQLRWEEMARRSQELSARTAAWRFDD